MNISSIFRLKIVPTNHYTHLPRGEFMPLNAKQSGGIFSSGRKSPKDKADKDKSKGKTPIAVAVAEQLQSKDAKPQQEKPSSPSHIRPYEYTVNDDNTSPTHKGISPHAFRYDEDPVEKAKRTSDGGKLSPSSPERRATGLAFNYAPGEDDALKQQAEKVKGGEWSPKSKDKIPKSFGTPVKSSKSYSPNGDDKPSGLAGVYRPHDDAAGHTVAGVDPTAAFLEQERDRSKVPIVTGVPASAASDGKKKRVKIMVIVSKFDPKTKRIDANNGSVEHSTGILNENGKIETKYGVVDPKKATVEVLNTNTGNMDTYQGHIDGKTGNLHFTSGVSNPKTHQLDDSLGQIVCIAPQDKTVIDVTGIVGRLDANGKVDIANGSVERSRGLLDLNTDIIETKYGNIDLRTSEIKVADPKTGKLTSKQVKYDANSGLFTIPGAVDQKTGKFDSSLYQIVALGSQIDPVVEVTSITGKVDKKGIVDTKTAAIENSTGQVNSNSGKIDTKYGQIDLIKHTITLSDPKTGKTETKDFKIDPHTGQIFIKNVTNPKTGKSDKDFAQVLSLKIVNRRMNPAGQVISSADGKDIVVDPKTNKIWVAGPKNAKGDEPSYYSSSQVDPKTGTITIVYGWVNPKTNEIEAQTRVNPTICITNSDGVVFTTTGEIDEATQQPIFAASIIEPETKNLVTKVSKVHPQTGELTLVRIDYPRVQAIPAPQQAQISTAKVQAAAKMPPPATPERASPTKITTTQAKHVTPPKVPIVSTTTPSTTVTSTETAKTPSQTPKSPSTQTSPAAVSTSHFGVDASEAVAIVPQKSAVIEIITIIGKVGPNGKVDVTNGQIERTRGILNVQNGTIDTKYGQFSPAAKEIKIVDKTGKATIKPVTIDPVNGSISVVGVFDSKTGKIDNSLGQVISLGSEIDPVVEVTAISGKYDSKKNIIDPKTAIVDVSHGQFDPDTKKITTSYGELDIPSSTITFKHPKTQKLEKKDVKFDPITGQLILRNELNPKSGKLDKDYGRIISLRIINRKIDPSTGKVSAPTVTGKDIIVDPQTNQIWVPESKDPITNETIYTSAQVDPKTGYIITIYGYLNPVTNQIQTHTTVESNITKVDPSGQLYVATGEVDECTGEPLYATSQIDEESGEIYTKVAKVDPKTGKLILIKIILITKKDERGIPKVVDASTVDVDPNTGAIRNIFNKTVYVYNMVDPVTGEIIQVDPNDP